MARPGRRGAALLAACVLFGVSCANSNDAVLPNNIRMVRPSGVPANDAAFAGKWHGNWDGKLDTYLIVERVEKDSAIVVYAWGRTKAFAPGFERRRAVIKGDMLTLQNANGPHIEFTLERNGKLDGTFEYRGAVSYATLTRQATPTA